MKALGTRWGLSRIYRKRFHWSQDTEAGWAGHSGDSVKVSGMGWEEGAMRIGGNGEADLKEGKGLSLHLSSESKRFSSAHLSHVSRQVSSFPQTTCTPKRFSLRKSL